MNEFTCFCIILNVFIGMVGDEKPKSGVLTSPNYPERYTYDLDSNHMIKVAEDKTIRFEWTNFNTEPEYDYVQIVDEDGTELLPRHSGNRLPPPGTSNSNIVYVKFHTDTYTQRTGWRLEWSEHNTDSKDDNSFPTNQREKNLNGRDKFCT